MTVMIPSEQAEEADTWSLREKYNLNMQDKYILHTRDLRKEDGVTYLPLYMAGIW